MILSLYEYDNEMLDLEERLEGDNESVLSNVTFIRNAIRSIYPNFFESVRESLDRNGICIIDLPKRTKLKTNISLYTSIIKEVFEPKIDPINGTPFFVYRQGIPSNKQDKRIFNTEESISFHNDGEFRANRAVLHKYIAIYNLHLSYKKTGYFRYIKLSSVDLSFADCDKNIFRPHSLSIEKRIYENNLETGIKKVAKVPFFYRNDFNESRVFFTGHQEKNPLPEILKLQENIEKSGVILNVEQKHNRMVILDNIEGMHSRTNMSNEGDYSADRVMLRSVSLQGENFEYL